MERVRPAGLVAGTVAAIGAEAALAVLQSKVFDFPWEPDWRLWLTLPVCGALCFHFAAAGSERGC